MSVEVNNESGVPADESEIVALARHVLTAMHVHPQAELSIVLVDEPAMEQLHVQWMDEPGPTDVLAFPIDEPLKTGSSSASPAEEPRIHTGPRELGDVFICPEKATDVTEAAVHGALHLCGFDHETDSGEMLELQAKVMASL